MVEPTPDTGRMPEIHHWPFDCLSLYRQMAQDFGRCAFDLSQSTDTMEAARAEGEFGLRLFSDLMRGYYDLALAPLTAMSAVIAEQVQAARQDGAGQAPPEVRSTTVRGQ